MTKYDLKKGEKLKLLCTYTVQGVVTTQLDIVISAQARTKNGNEAYNFTYGNMEFGPGTLGQYFLELNTASLPVGQYRADIKYFIADGSVHFDGTFEINITDPETRTP